MSATTPTSFSTSRNLIYLFNEGGHHLQTLTISEVSEANDFESAVSHITKVSKTPRALAENMAGQFHHESPSDMLKALED